MGWYEDWLQHQKNVATAEAVARGDAATAAALSPDAAKYITASAPAAQTAKATAEAVARGDAAAAAALSPNAAKYIGESASYIARGGAEEAPSTSKVGSILKTVATIAVPVVAAIAAPFLAPVIGTGLAAISLGGVGSALGLGVLGGAAATSFGAGLTGAALGAGAGAATGALTGRGALTGAITGGLGGGIGGYMGLGSALGIAPASTAPLNLPGSILAGTATAGGAMAPVAGGTSGLAGTLGLAGAGTVAAGAASPMLSNVIGGLVGKFAEGITAGGLADLGMTMYNKPPDGLTEEEKRAVAETAQLARTNKDLFAQRVEQANAVWNAAQANPEKAYAEAVSGVQRGLREQQRRYGTGAYGGTGSERRQAGLARAGSIEAQRAGSAAAAGETSRAEKDMISAAGLMPTSAPVGETMAALPLFQAAEKRKQQYQEQLARATGGLFGGIYNKNRPSQFSLSYGQ
jgi:hypothetical protein